MTSTGQASHEPADEEPRRGRRVLYITYDGLTDALGSSQVLPYLTELAALGHAISVISFEKPARRRQYGAKVESQCRAAGISWHPLTYHKQPPVLSTFYDVRAMNRLASRLHRRTPFDLVHCRSYVPAVGGLHLKRRSGVPFLFDMRGLWADERIEGGIWRLSNPLFRALYDYVKRLESRMLKQADHVISLTHAAKRELSSWPVMRGEPDKITVLPCCVDFDHFPLATSEARTAARRGLAIDANARVLAYLGSVGTWYLLDEMLALFRRYRERHGSAKFLIVTNGDPRDIQAAAARLEVAADALVIRSAGRDEVPKLMAAADLGLFFYKPTYSKVATSPTKMGEMMALGLPFVANGGVGDVAEIVTDTGCGTIVGSFDDSGYDAAIAAAEAITLPPDAIRARARALLDHRVGSRVYDEVYRSIGNAASRR